MADPVQLTDVDLKFIIGDKETSLHGKQIIIDRLEAREQSLVDAKVAAEKALAAQAVELEQMRRFVADVEPKLKKMEEVADKYEHVIFTAIQNVYELASRLAQYTKGGVREVLKSLKAHDAFLDQRLFDPEMWSLEPGEIQQMFNEAAREDIGEDKAPEPTIVSEDSEEGDLEPAVVGRIGPSPKGDGVVTEYRIPSGPPYRRIGAAFRKPGEYRTARPIPQQADEPKPA